MKLLIKAITVFSLISVLLLLLLEIAVSDTNRRLQFIIDWVQYILIGLSIPLMFRGLSLVANTKKMKPPVWLIIDGAATCIYFILLFSFGFWQDTKDLPNAAKGIYTSTSGAVHFTLPNQDKIEIFSVNGIDFQVKKQELGNMRNNDNYTIVFLENSRYVINIIDEFGDFVLN